MPHKRNPILAERVTGMARLLRADALVGLENMALWHERDISHSSSASASSSSARSAWPPTRRAPWPTSSTGSRWTPTGCAPTSSSPGGMVYSEALLLAMVAKGADRQAAYRLVQGAAQAGLGRRDRPSATPCATTRRVAEWLSADEIERAMDLDHHLAGIEVTYRALGLDEAG